jgi:segregation and condensation protein A
LQYRAFKEISAIFQGRIALADRSFPRLVAMESHFAQLLPEVLIGVGANRFAAIAERVLQPKSAPFLSEEHIHQPLVSVAKEAAHLVEALRRNGRVSFRTLISDTDSTLVVVARFLALLELYREGALRFEQLVPLGELQITWVAGSTAEIEVSDEFDRPLPAQDDEIKEA